MIADGGDQPPHDIRAEEAVLGAMMVSAGVIGDVSAIIDAADYYRPHHKIAHQVITGLHAQGAPVDPLAVHAELRRRGEAKPGALDMPRLFGLTQAAVPMSATHHAQIVRECADRRDLLDLAAKLAQAAADPESDPDKARARAMDALTGRQRAGQGAEQPDPLPEIPRFPVNALYGPLRDFVDWGIRDGLHPECVAAAAIAALATVTGPARLKVGTKLVKPILWTAVIGIASAGKSPAYEHAFAGIREAYACQREKYDAEVTVWEGTAETEGKKAAGPRPVRPEPFELDDATTEAVARWLNARGADTSGSVVDDELAAFLEGLNQYKGGQGADLSKWLKMWTGAPLHIQRVGAGGATNAISLYIPEPVVSVTGPLVPANLNLLGKPNSGFRPRWLPFYAPPVPPKWNHAGDYPENWKRSIKTLTENRTTREWTLAGDGRTEWERARQRWNAQQSDPEPDDVIEALRKADAQALRLALVIAESNDPGKDGQVPVAAVKSAIAIMDYCIRVWRALPGNSTMIASRREEVMDTAYRRLLAWLETRPLETRGLPEGSEKRHGASRRDVMLWLHESPEKIDDLIAEHKRRWPGCVVTVKPPRGPVGVWIYAPPRGDVQASPELSRQQFADASVHPSTEHETAGRSRPADTPETVARIVASDTQQFSATVSGAPAGGLRTFACSSCGTAWRTVVEPGETAYCKECDTEYTATEETCP